MVPELTPIIGSQPARDVSHKPDGRLPLLSAGMQLPSRPLRELLPILLLGEHGPLEATYKEGVYGRMR